MRPLSTLIKPAAMMVALTLPTAAAAQQTYYCTLSSGDQALPPEYGIVYTGNTAVVSFNLSDGPANYRLQTIQRRDEARLNFTTNPETSYGTPAVVMTYNMIHHQDTGAFSVTVSRVGTVQTFNGQGSCAQV